MLSRVQTVVRALDRDQRLAGCAAIALLFTMFLPWYEKNVFDGRTRRFAGDSISAFGNLTFIEAAIFLVSAGVLVLLFARGERKGFHLPGGDGTIIFAAGVWACVLLLWRVFDKPDVSGVGSTVGIQWGFFFAFVAAIALAATGWRVRAVGRPEPPLPVPQEEPATAATRVVARRRTPPRPSERATEQLTLDADEPPEREPLRPGEIPRAPDR